MGKNVYRTAAGVHVDVDTMRLLNEGTVAVGNMSVNARGDQVSSDGTIIKTRNEIMQEHYRNIEPVVKYNPNKKRGPQAAEPEVVAEAQVQPEPEPLSVASNLADNVAIDLVETPPVLKQKTLSRI